MTRALSTILTVSILSLFGCGGSSQGFSNQFADHPAKDSKQSAEYVVKATVDPAATDGWKVKEDLLGKKFEKPMKTYHAEKVLSDGTKALATIVSLPTKVPSETFAKDMLSELANDSDASLLDAKKIRVAGVQGAIALETRDVGEGRMVIIYDVFLSDGQAGYIVRCGGLMEGMSKWNDSCAKLLASTKLVK